MYKSKNLPWKEAVSFSLKSFINNVRIFCLAGALHMAVVVLEKLTLTGINFNLNIEDNTKEAFLEAIKIVSTSSWIFFFIKGIVLSLFVFGLTIVKALDGTCHLLKYIAINRTELSFPGLRVA